MRAATRASRTLLNLIVPLLLPLAAHGAQFAPLMPLAAQSLQLDVAVAGDRLVAAGERGNVLVSDDQGASWRQARVPTTQMLTAVHFVDERRGWAVGHDGLILVSDDGGETWRIQRDGLAVQHQDNLEARENAYHALRELQARADAADGAVDSSLAMALEDAQMDLEDAELALEEAVFTEPLLDVWFLDAERGWAVGAFGTMVATVDGGRQWRDHAARLDNPDEFHLNAVTGDARGRVFIAGEGGVMFRSLDAGRTWESLPPVYEGSWFGAVYVPRSDALLVFGLRGNLYRSRDFGQSWQHVETGTRVSLAGGSTSPDGHVVIAGGVGTLLQSADGGETFELSTLPERLSLSGGLYRPGRLILVGQQGAHILETER